MKGPSSLSWQAVAIVAIAVGGGVFLYVAVPAADPARGALLTAFNGLIGALTVYMLGRRQERAEEKIDKVIEQTNGHDDSTGQHVAR